MNSSEDIFDTYKKEMQEASTPPVQIGVDKERLWQRVNEQLNEKPVATLPKQRKFMPWGIAAAVLLGICITYWLQYGQQSPIVIEQELTIAQTIPPQKQQTEKETIINPSSGSNSKSLPEHTLKPTQQTRSKSLLAPNEKSKVTAMKAEESMETATIFNDDSPSLAKNNAMRKEISSPIVDLKEEKFIQMDTVVLENNLAYTDKISRIASGSIAKSRWVGGGDRVSSAQIAKRPITNVAQAIEGHLPGVQISTPSGQPGAGPTIRVRGYSSVNGSSDPLIVVDGAVFAGKLSDIKPENIASMEILKDATATSLYGSRGANGVILLTTKLGTQKAEKKAARAKKKADRKANRKQQ